MYRGIGVLAGLIVVLPSFLGCGGDTKPPDPVPVSGRALKSDSSPLANVVLRFHPQDDLNKRAPNKAGNDAVTDSNGNFSHSLVKGRYHVTFIVPGKGGVAAGGASGSGPAKVDVLSGPYQDPKTTPWRVTVPDDGLTNRVLKMDTDTR
jgi:hypothetical protein